MQAWLRQRWLWTCTAILLIVAGSELATRSIYQRTHQAIQDQLIAQTHTTARLLNSMDADRLDGLRVLTHDPEVLSLLNQVLQTPEDSAARLAFGSLIDEFLQRWSLQPYWVLLSDDLIIQATLDPTLIGRSAQPGSRRLMERAMRDRTVIMPPIRAVVTRQASEQAGQRDYYLHVCQHLEDLVAGGGYLCVSSDPREDLFQVLNTSRFGGSGEAYLIDEDGRLRSPSRFDSDFVGDPEDYEPLQVSRLYARVSTGLAMQADGDNKLALPTADAPLTAMASGLIEARPNAPLYRADYVDYRGVPVVGAGLWLHHSQLGLVIELDLNEAEQSAYLAAAWIRGLAVLGIACLLLLTWRDYVARRSLARSEAELSAFMQNAPFVMHMQDAQGRYLKANGSYGNLLGKPVEQLLRKTDQQLSGLDPELAALRDAQRDDVLRSGEPISMERGYTGSQGEQRYARIIRFPIILDGQSAAIGVGTIGLDMTAEIAMREHLRLSAEQLASEVQARTADLQLARDEAESAARAKADFLASMSHEIRTPLNAITGISHLAQRLNRDPKIGHYLTRLRGSSEHLLAIVNDILDFSKLESDKLEIEVAEFSPAELLEDVAALLSTRAHQKGLELLLDLDPEVPERLRGDARRLLQVLLNFASNAVKFTEHGWVKIHLQCLSREAHRAQLRFCVQDSGIGMESHRLAELFQPFHQLDQSGTRVREGTGLGLAISRRLADLMQGKVAVESAIGRGSSFSLELWLDDLGDPHQAASTIELSGTSVLLLDSPSEAHQLHCHWLRRAGADLQVLSHAQALLQGCRDLLGRGDNRPVTALLEETDLTPDLVAKLIGLQSEFPSLRVLLLARGEPNTCVPTHWQLLQCPLLPQALVLLRGDAPSTALSQPSRVVGRSESRFAEALRGMRVLVVEDNAINREVVTDLLNLVAVEVTTAEDGVQALRLLSRQPFDAVLMDMHMPVLDGVEATRTLRADPNLQALPVIALSASVMESDHQRCREAGMNAFVSKPIVPAELYTALLQHRVVAASEPTQDGPLSAEPAASESDAAPAWLQAMRSIEGLDADQALGFFDHNPALLHRYASRALEVAPQRLDELRDAIARRDIAVCRRSVHDMASLLGSLGAPGLRRRCGELEALLEREQWPQAELSSLLQAAETCLTALREAIAGAPTAS